MNEFDGKLTGIQNRYDEVMESLADPSVLADIKRYQKLSRELTELEEIVSCIRKRDEVTNEYNEAKTLFQNENDADMREMARQEISELSSVLESLEEQLREFLSPKDPNDERSVIIEIRAGAGGDEAALFCGVLFRMYSAYAQGKGWQAEYIDGNETELGGFKEVIFSIEGQGAYSRFKYESGVHRVQRVPVTESSGRIHTSTVTVAVLPEAEAVDVNIQPGDLRIDTFRASGAGGQHVNRTESAIRITHLPTGIVVQCQDERSQHKNKDKAMAVLMTRLMEMENEKQTGSIAKERKSQVGTGDRSERIRTYNYHQGRVTDHRIGLTAYRLDEILAGDIDEFVNRLIILDRNNRLEAESRGG